MTFIHFNHNRASRVTNYYNRASRMSNYYNRASRVSNYYNRASRVSNHNRASRVSNHNRASRVSNHNRASRVSNHNRVLWSVVIGHSAFIEVNFSKLTHNNQIFRNDFIFSHYHPCKISAQIMAGKIIVPYELSITLYSLWLEVVKRQRIN